VPGGDALAEFKKVLLAAVATEHGLHITPRRNRERLGEQRHAERRSQVELHGDVLEELPNLSVVASEREWGELQRL